MSTTERPESTHDWWIYRGTGHPLQDTHLADRLPPPPPWRDFRRGDEPPAVDVPQDDAETDRRLGVELSFTAGHADRAEVDMVNAALYLRRPLLVTGKPGSGKSTLAYRISRELRLGRVLRWSVTSQTTLKSGLYDYDAIGRLQASQTHGSSSGGTGTGERPVGDFFRLRELGTAFLPRRLPRVLLVDELDKAESDLPHDLLSIFEDGEFLIPELARDARSAPVAEVFTADPGYTAQIENGVVRCSAFPVVIITSNGERDFPPAFLRRCLRLEMKDPGPAKLAAIVAAHALDPKHRAVLIEDFVTRRAALGGLPADKLLDAIFLATSGAYQPDDPSWPGLVEALWQHLNQQGH
ncbi:AAA family ATPase [Amycolatopsis mongoliensis]|uniref:AAA family ATPase n=1 Tax=Amycolatopsis mongoliensis TaxID=715475 RepID=A0A9Y2JYJ7_9PSEU|nr:AAA family ATPase [Amycolatopsis sp. 4-36]WIY06009.1 AAA family ATPase [Amycolatopsis sp. 4-36]